MNIESLFLEPNSIIMLCLAGIAFMVILAYRFTKHIKSTVEDNNNDAKWTYLVFAVNGSVTWYLITFENFFADKFGIMKQFGSPIALFMTIAFLLIFVSRFRVKNQNKANNHVE